MKLVYVAGPFRSTNANGRANCWGIQKNVMAAMAVALEVWKTGNAAICPHANTMFFQDADGVADGMWLAGDLVMLDKCDAIVFAPNWEASSGSREEHRFAAERAIPIFYNVDEFKQWLNNEKA